MNIILQEMPDMTGKGKTSFYPRTEHVRSYNTEELITSNEYIGIARTQLYPALQTIMHEMQLRLSMGYSVKIDGLGTFSLSLRFKDSKDSEAMDTSNMTDEEVAELFSYHKVEIKGINFLPDKEMMAELRRDVTFEKRGVCRLAGTTTTEAEHLEIAKDYLRSHPFMSVQTYAKLTGQKRSTAGRELIRLRERPDSGIRCSGRGSHMVYVAAHAES